MTAGTGHNAAGLTDDQVKLLRDRLERRRVDLRRRLERDQAVAREAEPEVEPIDAAEQTREQDDAILHADRDRAELREVEDAIRRIAAGSYGVSEVSGEPISFQRLLAIPWARTDSDEDPDQSG